MQAVLVMFRSDGEKRSFSVSREMTVIGRRQDCDLMIPLGEISRKHCRIIKEADTLRLEDLGSSNGTYHNGRRVQETVLAAGDTIQVGPVTFVVQIDGVPSDDEITPFASGAVAAEGHGDYQESAEDYSGQSDDAMPTEGAHDDLGGIDDAQATPAPGQVPGPDREDELEVLPDEPELEMLDDGARPAEDVPPPPPTRR